VTTINENKLVPVLITFTIKTELKAEPSIADLSAINKQASDLKQLDADYGAWTVEGHVLIGEHKFKLAD
jgi:hypothetical protein